VHERAETKGEWLVRVRTATELGALIRDRRTAARMSREQLARAAGVSLRWLVAAEGGKTSVELGLVLQTLRALGAELAVVEATAPEVDLDRLLADLDHGPDGATSADGAG
jgi:transcriptional regulator with XRE-family HTH domain